MATYHHIFEAGEFVFGSGAVCYRAHSDEVLVLYDRDSGEYGLPHGPCKWLPQLQVGGTEYSMEKFDAAALRNIEEQTGCTMKIMANSEQPTLQPTTGESGAGNLNNPVMMETRVTNSGICKTTVWFLAFYDPPIYSGTTTYPLRDSLIKMWIDESTAIALLPFKDAQVVMKASSMKHSFYWFQQRYRG
ncbi:hypothetical protein MMC06_004907 [Schaereria dolodes]|nr:hypothetical protein [Schaereria dolodes]